jgi:hypothetical protein
MSQNIPVKNVNKTTHQAHKPLGCRDIQYHRNVERGYPQLSGEATREAVRQSTKKERLNPTHLSSKLNPNQPAQSQVTNLLCGRAYD